jgi:DNA replication protein DnaC
MSSKALKEHLEQLAPRTSVEHNTAPTEDFSSLPLPELTPQEMEALILAARRKKFADIEQEKFNREYWEKLTRQHVAKNYTAEELRNRLHRSVNADGKRFTIDKDNQAQVNALCLYFSGDSRLENYGLVHSKGIMLMGPLGVGKSHLMSFFMQNQKASYVMAQCNKIQNKWQTTDMTQESAVDWIAYYERTIGGALNSNPYGHTHLGACFDDLGREEIPAKRFGEQKNVMAEIILMRYDRIQQESLTQMEDHHRFKNHHTHFTTNKNADQLEALYGDRVRDRLKEMCNIIVFPETTKSRRS